MLRQVPAVRVLRALVPCWIFLFCAGCDEPSKNGTGSTLPSSVSSANQSQPVPAGPKQAGEVATQPSSTTSAASGSRIGPTIAARSGSAPVASNPPAAPQPPQRVPATIDEAELQFAELCRSAKQAKRPILMEFTADWCKDCKVIHGFKQKPPLAGELTRWQSLSVDVDLEPYEPVVTAFDVKAIARWILFDSASCNGAVKSWKVLSDRVLEPTSDMAITGPGLSAWLSMTRNQLSR